MKAPESDDRERPLEESDMDPDPLTAFGSWLREARERAGTAYPEAAWLATVGEDGFPQGRIVLLKEADEAGFVFYTNFRSEKGRALTHSPRASLGFYWDALWRQVRVQGEVEVAGEDEADAYFATRPRESQLGAWASEQSEPLEGRSVLEARYREVEGRFEGTSVPRPPHWGGYRLVPRRYEFWQGRAGRLHDRFRYTRTEAAGWVLVRLNP